MSMEEILLGGGGVLLAAMTLIQVRPSRSIRGPPSPRPSAAPSMGR